MQALYWLNDFEGENDGRLFKVKLLFEAGADPTSYLDNLAGQAFIHRVIDFYWIVSFAFLISYYTNIS